MSNSLNDMHALVTGGASGIGAAIADRLDALGAHLTLVGRRLEPLQQKAATLRNARAISADVTRESDVQAAFDRARDAFGPVAILVNNAGAAASAPFDRLTLAEWQGLIEVNLTSVFLCSRAALPAMRDRKWGRIINVASTAGLKGYPYVAAYCAAKHGIVGLTRALALETARTGVTVNAVCPGYTNTALLDGALDKIVRKTGMERAAAEQQLKAANPQNRFVEPEEVAAAVAYLCGKGSDALTGLALPISGGEVM